MLQQVHNNGSFVPYFVRFYDMHLQTTEGKIRLQSVGKIEGKYSDFGSSQRKL